jgi:hypothetical protein
MEVAVLIVLLGLVAWLVLRKRKAGHSQQFTRQDARQVVPASVPRNSDDRAASSIEVLPAVMPTAAVARRVAEAPVTAAPGVKITFTTSVSSGSRDSRPPLDYGQPVAQADGSWTLIPKAPFPITVLGADAATAQKVQENLIRHEWWSQKVPELALLIAQHNLRFREIEDFVAQSKPKFDAEVQRLKAANIEWDSASEKDKADLLADFEVVAADSLGISIGDADLATVLKGQPGGFTDDDELVRMFAGDHELYSFYLSALGRTNPVATVKAEDWSRKRWEQLVEKGLARRGKDIPVQLLLEGLRLKDLNEVLAGTIPKPLGRKAKAVDAALALPDLHQRLSKVIAFREMFEVLKPQGLDVSSLVTSFGYATDIANVLQQTSHSIYRTMSALRDKQEDKHRIYNAWEIRNWQDPLPACAKAYCRQFTRLAKKLPPFHIGCTCELEATYKECDITIDS